MYLKKVSLFLLLPLVCSCGRSFRTAQDITPGHLRERELDWRYGANDIRIQTTAIMKELMDRWYLKSEHHSEYAGKPRITITEVDNQSDQYIALEMVREIFEGVAVNDGRFVMTVGNEKDEAKLDEKIHKITHNKKYEKSENKPSEGSATTPEFLARIRLTKAVTLQPRYEIQDYRMTVLLYDLESQEIVDSAWDVLRKKVQGK